MTRRRSSGSTWARWRVAGRLARRQVRRTILSSILVATLVALPIAAMTAFVIYSTSTLGTPQERVHAELGEMQAWVQPVGVPGAGMRQSPDQPMAYQYPQSPDGTQQPSEGEPILDPTAVLPAGTATIPIAHGLVRVDTRDGVGSFEAWEGASWDPRFTGRFDLVEGRRPAAPGEAMVTPSALARLGIEVGGSLRLPDAKASLTVVGTLRAAALPTKTAAVFLPDMGLIDDERQWFLPDSAPGWHEIEGLNEHGVVVYSRDVVLDPPTIVDQATETVIQNTQAAWWAQMWTLLLAVLAAGAIAGYVVVMLAGSAFAVAARRQQRSLAIAASVGAGRGDLGRIVLLQGTTLGLIGGVTGLALGVGLAALVMGMTADGSATQFWTFRMPWPMLLAVLGFAVLVGTVAALMPARSIARTDVIGALRGTRRPKRPRVSHPIWGTVLLLVGLGATAVGTAVLVATSGDVFSGNGEVPPYRIAASIAIVAGPILVQLGIVVAGRWLLWVISVPLSKVGFAARIASRDVAANAGRTVPAFAAIGATVFIGVFALCQSAMQTAETERSWSYSAPVGSLVVYTYPMGGPGRSGDPHDAEQTADTAVELVRSAGADRIAPLRQQHLGYDGEPTADMRRALAILPDGFLSGPGSGYSTTGGFGPIRNPGNNLSIVAPDDLETVLGIPVPAHDVQLYRGGAAIVTDDRYVTEGRIDVAGWSEIDASQGRIPDNLWIRQEDSPPIATPLWKEQLHAISVAAPRQPVTIAISPETATRLGIITVQDRTIGSFAAAPSTATLDRVRAQADAGRTRDLGLSVSLETGPPSPIGWMVPLLTVVSVLVLAASAVALGLARFERRPDDATLAAIGGTRGFRRAVGGWQGLIVAGFGTIAGTLAGILPPIGLALQSQDLRIADIPWAVLAGLAVGLPLAIAAANWLVPPGSPVLGRRTVIS